MKRVFFALEAVAPWPDSLPHGRLLDPLQRHATVAFLGNVDWEKMNSLLCNIPLLNFPSGLAGFFDKSLLLPNHHSPHVVAWHVNLLDHLQEISSYQMTLTEWLKSQNYRVEERKWLPHVTLARQPLDSKKWQEAFIQLPMYFKALHLYESLGNLNYQPLWSSSLPLPWIEIEHTADVAFRIIGKNILEIYQHAKLALAWKFPELLNYWTEIVPSCLDDVIIMLNEEVSRADEEVGCPYKAVSLHGELVEVKKILTWEMVVDV